MIHKKKYRFGDIVIEVNTPVPLLESPHLRAFETEGEDAHIVYDVVTGREGAPEKKGKRITAFLGDRDISKITAANLFGYLNTASLLLEHHAFVLHCSYVLKDGEAVLFTAPSGTGKSTQAHYWRDELSATVVNEDRAVIFKRNGVYHAGGCWAMGSADTCLDICAPIRAVVILSQAKSNAVRVPGGGAALSGILPQCTFDDKTLMGRLSVIEEVTGLVGGVKVLSLECIDDPSAAYELEKYL